LRVARDRLKEASRLRAGVTIGAVALLLTVGILAALALRPGPTEQVAEAEPVASTGPEPAVDTQPQPEYLKIPDSEPPGPLPQPEPSEPEPSQPEPSRPEQPQRQAQTDWPGPKPGEEDLLNGPRHFELVDGAVMGLTVRAIGIHNAPVFDSNSQWALDNGVVHVPRTSFPWSNTEQRNVYLAGHRLGYSGTASRLLFYRLGELRRGDEVVLKSREGRTYRYRVTESFVVSPSDRWVMGQVRNRDMVTLQTCTPIPAFNKRLIVRAERI
jgi:sortase A